MISPRKNLTIVEMGPVKAPRLSVVIGNRPSGRPGCLLALRRRGRRPQ